MAALKKKTGSAKKALPEKKTTKSGAKTVKRTVAAPKTKIETAEKKRRQSVVASQITGLACFAFAILLLLSQFSGFAGVAGDFLRDVLRGLFGWTSFLFPIVVAYIGFCFIVRLEKSTLILRCVASLLFLVVVSAFSQLFFADMAVSELYAKSVELKAAGVLGGAVSSVLCSVLGKGGTGVLFVFIALAMFIGMTGITLQSIVAFVTSPFKKLSHGGSEQEDTEEEEYDPEPESTEPRSVGILEYMKKKLTASKQRRETARRAEADAFARRAENYRPKTPIGRPAIKPLPQQTPKFVFPEEPSELPQQASGKKPAREMNFFEKLREEKTVSTEAQGIGEDELLFDDVRIPFDVGVEPPVISGEESSLSFGDAVSDEVFVSEGDGKAAPNEANFEAAENDGEGNTEENNASEDAAAENIDFTPIPEIKEEASEADLVVSAGEMKQQIKEPPYIRPPITLLREGVKNTVNEDFLRQKGETLIRTLKSFGVDATLQKVVKGPRVVRFEIQPSAGVRVNKITSLTDDLALALAAEGVRIEAPIPGRSVAGIEMPSDKADTVALREIIESSEFQNAKSSLSVAVGKDISGKCVVADLASFPHVLIAGTTGSGKSVCINSMIISLIYKSSPEDVKLIMIDPKMVELGGYNGLPHLLIPVVTDAKKAAGALDWAVSEMMRRYNVLSAYGVKDIKSFNEMVEREQAKLADDAADSEVAGSGGSNKEPELIKMPKVVIIIDELADMMMVAKNEVEDSICRIAQMARAVGMHLVIATQRPSVNVITGLIKANVPSRIAFSVSSQIDSRTIIDTSGAEHLLGKGDLLYFPIGMQKPVRVQGCFVSESETEQVANFVKRKGLAEYSDQIMEHIERVAAATGSEKPSGADGAEQVSLPGDKDDMLERAIEIVVEADRASVTILQSKLSLGYARAARIIQSMEDMGIVGPYEGSKPRKVLMTRSELQERKLHMNG